MFYHMTTIKNEQLIINFNIDSSRQPIKIYSKNLRKYLHILELHISTRLNIEKHYRDYLSSKIYLSVVDSKKVKKYKQSSFLIQKLTNQQIDTVIRCLEKESRLSDKKHFSFSGSLFDFENITFICDKKQTGKSFVPLELSSHDFNFEKLKIKNKHVFNSTMIIVPYQIIEQWQQKLNFYYKGGHYKVIKKISDFKPYLKDFNLPFSNLKNVKHISDFYKLKIKSLDGSLFKENKIIIISTKIIEQFMFYMKISNIILSRVFIDSFFCFNITRFKKLNYFNQELFINFYIMTNQKDLIAFYDYSSKIKALYNVYSIKFFNFIMSNIFKIFSMVDDLNDHFEKSRNDKYLIENYGPPSFNTGGIDESSKLKISSFDLKIKDYKTKLNNISKLLKNIFISYNHTDLEYKKYNIITLASRPKELRYVYNYFHNDIQNMLLKKDYMLFNQTLNLNTKTFKDAKKHILFNIERFITPTFIYYDLIEDVFSSEKDIIDDLHIIKDETLKIKRFCNPNINEFNYNLSRVSINIGIDKKEFIIDKLLNLDKLLSNFEKNLAKSIDKKNRLIKDRLHCNKECPICYETIECPLITRCCKNVFCVKCFTRFYFQNRKCLNCREEVCMQTQFVIKDKILNQSKITISEIKDNCSEKTSVQNIESVISYIKIQNDNPKIIFVINDEKENSKNIIYPPYNIYTLDKFKDVQSLLYENKLTFYQFDITSENINQYITRFNNSLLNCIIVYDSQYKQFNELGFKIKDLDYVISYESKIYITDDELPKIINKSNSNSKKIEYFSIQKIE